MKKAFEITHPTSDSSFTSTLFFAEDPVAAREYFRKLFGSAGPVVECPEWLLKSAEFYGVEIIDIPA